MILNAQAAELLQVCHNAVSELINESKMTSNCYKRVLTFS